MIAKITGAVTEIHEEAIMLERDGLGYEVLVPGGLALRLRQHGAVGSDLTLHTLEYIEGGTSGGTMVPRLVGFMDPLDREFYRLLTSVKGLGPKKALKALAISTKQFATSIENGDHAVLCNLPAVGKRSAEKIVAELRGKCQKFALMRGGELLETDDSAAVAPDVRSETMQILTTQLQYAPVEAEAMINKVTASGTKFESSQDLISEIFRVLSGN